MQLPEFNHQDYAEYVKIAAMNHGHDFARASKDYLDLHPHHTDSLAADRESNRKAYELLSNEIKVICEQRVSAIGRPFRNSADDPPSPVTVPCSFVTKDGLIVEGAILNGGTRTPRRY